MAHDWALDLYEWASAYGVVAPGLWCSLEVLKARMLRAFPMPDGDMEGRWYRFVVCSLERADADLEPPGTWRWMGSSHLTRACYYAVSDDGENFNAFLIECQRAYSELQPDLRAEDIVWALLAATRDRHA